MLRKKKEKILKQNPARSFVPNGKIEQFIELVGTGTFISVISAGNGVGKTAAGSNIVTNICYGKQNEWFDYPIFNNFPFPKHGRIVSNTKTIEETIVGGQKELERWLPEGRYTAIKGGKTYNSKFTTDTGFAFDVMTYEQDVQEFESKTLGWVWFDEPPPRAIFKATVARMRRGGIIFITDTPLMNAAWMYDEIITKPEPGQRDFVEADIEDNCIEHGVRGILEHSNIEKMIAEYDEDEREARIHGRFQHLVGRVFKKFNPKVHVIKPFTIKKSDFVVWEHLDQHTRNPDAVVWIAVDRKGTKFIINELYGSYTTGELATKINKKSEDYRIERRLMDPSGFVENQHEENPTESTFAAKLYALGLDYEPATKNRTAADRRIKDAIDYEERGGEIVVAPELYVFDICKRTIYEFEHLQWDDFTGKAAERKDPREKPMDKDDHMLEGIGRILIQEPEFTRYVPEQTYQHIGVKTEKSMDPFA